MLNPTLSQDRTRAQGSGRYPGALLASAERRETRARDPPGYAKARPWPDSATHWHRRGFVQLHSPAEKGLKRPSPPLLLPAEAQIRFRPWCKTQADLQAFQEAARRT